MSAELVAADVLPLIAFHGPQGCNFERVLYYCSRSLTAAHTVVENTFPQWMSVADSDYVPVSTEAIIDLAAPPSSASPSIVITKEVVDFPDLLDDMNLLDDPALRLAGVAAPVDFDFDTHDDLNDEYYMPSCALPDTLPPVPTYTMATTGSTTITSLFAADVCSFLIRNPLFYIKTTQAPPDVSLLFTSLPKPRYPPAATCPARVLSLLECHALMHQVANDAPGPYDLSRINLGCHVLALALYAGVASPDLMHAGALADQRTHLFPLLLSPFTTKQQPLPEEVAPGMRLPPQPIPGLAQSKIFDATTLSSPNLSIVLKWLDAYNAVLRRVPDGVLVKPHNPSFLTHLAQLYPLYLPPDVQPPEVCSYRIPNGYFPKHGSEASFPHPRAVTFSPRFTSSPILRVPASAVFVARAAAHRRSALGKLLHATACTHAPSRALMSPVACYTAEDECMVWHAPNVLPDLLHVLSERSADTEFAVKHEARTGVHATSSSRSTVPNIACSAARAALLRQVLAYDAAVDRNKSADTLPHLPGLGLLSTHYSTLLHARFAAVAADRAQRGSHGGRAAVERTHSGMPVLGEDAPLLGMAPADQALLRASPTGEAHSLLVFDLILRSNAKLFAAFTSRVLCALPALPLVFFPTLASPPSSATAVAFTHAAEAPSTAIAVALPHRSPAALSLPLPPFSLSSPDLPLERLLLRLVHAARRRGTGALDILRCLPLTRRKRAVSVLMDLMSAGAIRSVTFFKEKQLSHQFFPTVPPGQEAPLEAGYFPVVSTRNRLILDECAPTLAAESREESPRKATAATVSLRTPAMSRKAAARRSSSDASRSVRQPRAAAAAAEDEDEAGGVSEDESASEFDSGAESSEEEEFNTDAECGAHASADETESGSESEGTKVVLPGRKRKEPRAETRTVMSVVSQGVPAPVGGKGPALVPIMSADAVANLVLSISKAGKPAVAAEPSSSLLGGLPEMPPLPSLAALPLPTSTPLDGSLPGMAAPAFVPPATPAALQTTDAVLAALSSSAFPVPAAASSATLQVKDEPGVPPQDTPARTRRRSAATGSTPPPAPEPSSADALPPSKRRRGAGGATTQAAPPTPSAVSSGATPSRVSLASPQPLIKSSMSLRTPMRSRKTKAQQDAATAAAMGATPSVAVLSLTTVESSRRKARAQDTLSLQALPMPSSAQCPCGCQHAYPELFPADTPELPARETVHPYEYLHAGAPADLPPVVTGRIVACPVEVEVEVEVHVPYPDAEVVLDITRTAIDTLNSDLARENLHANPTPAHTFATLPAVSPVSPPFTDTVKAENTAGAPVVAPANGPSRLEPSSFTPSPAAAATAAVAEVHSSVPLPAAPAVLPRDMVEARLRLNGYISRQFPRCVALHRHLLWLYDVLTAQAKARRESCSHHAQATDSTAALCDCEYLPPLTLSLLVATMPLHLYMQVIGLSAATFHSLSAHPHLLALPLFRQPRDHQLVLSCLEQQRRAYTCATALLTLLQRARVLRAACVPLTALYSGVWSCQVRDMLLPHDPDSTFAASLPRAVTDSSFFPAGESAFAWRGCSYVTDDTDLSMLSAPRPYATTSHATQQFLRHCPSEAYALGRISKRMSRHERKVVLRGTVLLPLSRVVVDNVMYDVGRWSPAPMTLQRDLTMSKAGASLPPRCIDGVPVPALVDAAERLCTSTVVTCARGAAGQPAPRVPGSESLLPAQLCVHCKSGACGGPAVAQVVDVGAAHVMHRHADREGRFDAGKKAAEVFTHLHQAFPETSGVWRQDLLQVGTDVHAKTAEISFALPPLDATPLAAVSSARADPLSLAPMSAVQRMATLLRVVGEDAPEDVAPDAAAVAQAIATADVQTDASVAGDAMVDTELVLSSALVPTHPVTRAMTVASAPVLAADNVAAPTLAVQPPTSATMAALAPTQAHVLAAALALDPSISWERVMKLCGADARPEPDATLPTAADFWQRVSMMGMSNENLHVFHRWVNYAHSVAGPRSSARMEKDEAEEEDDNKVPRGKSAKGKRQDSREDDGDEGEEEVDTSLLADEGANSDDEDDDDDGSADKLEDADELDDDELDADIDCRTLTFFDDPVPEGHKFRLFTPLAPTTLALLARVTPLLHEDLATLAASPSLAVRHQRECLASVAGREAFQEALVRAYSLCSLPAAQAEVAALVPCVCCRVSMRVRRIMAAEHSSFNPLLTPFLSAPGIVMRGVAASLLADMFTASCSPSLSISLNTYTALWPLRAPAPVALASLLQEAHSLVGVTTVSVLPLPAMLALVRFVELLARAGVAKREPSTHALAPDAPGARDQLFPVSSPVFHSLAQLSTTFRVQDARVTSTSPLPSARASPALMQGPLILSRLDPRLLHDVSIVPAFFQFYNQLLSSNNVDIVHNVLASVKAQPPSAAAAPMGGYLRDALPVPAWAVSRLEAPVDDAGFSAALHGTATRQLTMLELSDTPQPEATLTTCTRLDFGPETKVSGHRGVPFGHVFGPMLAAMPSAVDSGRRRQSVSRSLPQPSTAAGPRLVAKIRAHPLRPPRMLMHPTYSVKHAAPPTERVNREYPSALAMPLALKGEGDLESALASFADPDSGPSPLASPRPPAVALTAPPAWPLEAQAMLPSLALASSSLALTRASHASALLPPNQVVLGRSTNLPPFLTVDSMGAIADAIYSFCDPCPRAPALLEVMALADSAAMTMQAFAPTATTALPRSPAAPLLPSALGWFGFRHSLTPLYPGQLCHPLLLQARSPSHAGADAHADSRATSSSSSSSSTGGSRSYVFPVFLAQDSPLADVGLRTLFFSSRIRKTIFCLRPTFFHLSGLLDSTNTLVSSSRLPPLAIMSSLRLPLRVLQAKFVRIRARLTDSQTSQPSHTHTPISSALSFLSILRDLLDDVPFTRLTNMDRNRLFLSALPIPTHTFLLSSVRGGGMLATPLVDRKGVVQPHKLHGVVAALAVALQSMGTIGVTTTLGLLRPEKLWSITIPKHVYSNDPTSADSAAGAVQVAVPHYAADPHMVLLSLFLLMKDDGQKSAFHNLVQLLEAALQNHSAMSVAAFTATVAQVRENIIAQVNSSAKRYLVNIALALLTALQGLDVSPQHLASQLCTTFLPGGVTLLASACAAMHVLQRAQTRPDDDALLQLHTHMAANGQLLPGADPDAARLALVDTFTERYSRIGHSLPAGAEELMDVMTAALSTRVVVPVVAGDLHRLGAGAVTETTSAAVRALCSNCADMLEAEDKNAHVSEVVSVDGGVASPPGLGGLAGLGLTPVPDDDGIAAAATIAQLPLSVPPLTNAWFVAGVCSQTRVERVLRCVVGVLLANTQINVPRQGATDPGLSVLELCNIVVETCAWLSLQAASEFVAAMILADLITASLDGQVDKNETAVSTVSRRRKVVIGIPGHALLDMWEQCNFHQIRVRLTKPELCINLSDDNM